MRVSSSEVENKFIKLEQKIEMLQASIDEHEDKFNGMNELDTDTLNENMDMLEEFDAYLYNQIYLLENIIKQTTLHKTAMLNSAEIDGNTLNINVTYTSKLIDEEAPNGYRLENTGEEISVLRISKDVPIFILENPKKSIEATWDQLVEHRGFFQLFEKNGEVVFISELYLP